MAKTTDGRTIVCGSHGKEVCCACGVATAEMPESIAKNEFFHANWEAIQKAIGVILSEAYNPNVNSIDWVEYCNKAMNELDRLKAMGYNIAVNKDLNKHNSIK